MCNSFNAYNSRIESQQEKPVLGFTICVNKKTHGSKKRILLENFKRCHQDNIGNPSQVI